MTPHRRRRATLRRRPPRPSPTAAAPPPPAAAPTGNPVSEWVLEYLLRQPNIDDSRTNEAFSLLSLSPPFSPRLKKTILLRRIASDLSRRSLSERTLHSLELIEELDRLSGAHPPSDSMKTAYCSVALHCAVRFLRGGNDAAFSDAVERIWMCRLGDLERSEAGELVSGVVEDGRNALERALVCPCGKARLLERDTEEEDDVQRYWKEALEGIGPPFLDKAARVVGVLPPGSQERNADGRDAIVLDGGETTSGSPVRSIDKIREGEPARAQDATDQEGYSVCGIDCLPMPEVSKGTAALKTWFANLLMMVQDPIPDVVTEVAQMQSVRECVDATRKESTRTSVVAPAQFVCEGADTALKEVTSTSTSTREVAPARSVREGGDATYKEGSSTASEQNKASIQPRTRLMDWNPTACTLQWGDDSIESPSESSLNPLKRIRLPSPTRRFVSHLKVAEDITSRKHRKIKRRSVLEEDALRKAVERAIMAKGKEKLASSNVPDEIEAAGDDVTAETIASEPVNLEAEGLEEAEKAELESSVEEEEAEEEENNSDEVKKDEANKDGPIDAEMTLIVPENETAVEGDKKEMVPGDKGVENISNKKIKRARKKKAGDDVTAETIASEPVNLEAEDLEEAEKAELESSEEEEELEEEENNSDEVKKDEANKDGPIDAEMTLIVPENETAVEGDTKEVVPGDKGVENISNKKRKRARKKKVASNDAGAASPKDSGKTDSSAAEKDKFSGLIFMCNSKTKEDCYKYKILGLPESKKDTVAKIHKGMRLFLYDLDLKLMYGIYKAANNGGYDIEPKAFKSAFPSQVRFTVLNDCKPLPEAKFRAAIKSNYFWGNKFHPQLSLEQVKNLCTLFTSESNTPLKRKRRVPREPTSARCDQEKMKIHRFHHVPHHAVPGLFVRDAYVPPTPRQLVMAPPPAAYVYDRPVDDYYYRRDPPLEHRESRLVEIRPHEPMVYERDPYSSYSQPAAYREPLYPASLSTSAYAPPASAYAHPSTSAYGPPPNYPY